MTETNNQLRLAAELDGAIKAISEVKNAMTCANEASAADDHRTMSEDLWRAAKASEDQAAHFRGAAALAQLISQGRP